MTDSKATIKTRTLVIVAGMVAAVFLGAVCGRAVMRGSDLREELVRGQALHTAGDRIAPLVKDGAQAELSRLVQNLVRDAGIGLTYLAVSDSSGAVLAVDGRFEQLAVPLLSQLARQKLRAWLYRVTSERGTYELRQDGVGVGRVEYAVSPMYARKVREEAISELKIVSWVGLALSLFAMASLGYLFMLRPEDPDPKVVARSRQEAPQRVTASHLEDPEEEAASENLRKHGIHALDSLSRALIVVDVEARVTYMNRTATEITGWSAEEARGRLVYSVFHPLDEDQSPLVTPAESCLREGREYEATELLLRARDGKTLYAVEVMAALLRNGPDSHVGAAMVFHLIDERKKLVDHLRRQARLSIAVIDQLVEGVFTTDTRGVIRFANARALRMFGYAKGELEGTLVTQLLPIPFLKQRDVSLTDYIGGRRGGRLPKVAGWRRDASTFPVDLVVQPMKVDGAEGLVVIARDDTERTRSDNLSQRLGRLLDVAADEVYMFDARSLQFVEVNRGARENLGRGDEDVTHLTPMDISLELEPEQFEAHLDRLRSGDVTQVRYRCRHQRVDGSDYPVEVRLSYSSEEEPPVFMAIAVDVSDREAEEGELRYLAHHDSLTGLPNRTTLTDRLAQTLLASARGNKVVAVCVIDLHRFKSVNDNHGHEGGDAVLIETGQRLKSLVRDCDSVGRIGGDEFGVIAGGLRGPEDGEALARKLLSAFAEPYAVELTKLRVSASIGLAMYPMDDSGAEALVRHADAAMNQAKQAGAGEYRIYDAELSPEKQREFELERGIGAALTLQQIDVDAQMAVELSGATAGRVAAVVLDCTWHHPRLGRIETSDMLRTAYRAGFQADLELWQIYRACTVLPAPAQSQLDAPLIPVVVRISAWQLCDKDFYAHLFELMNRHEVPPRRLILAVDAVGVDRMHEAPAQSLRRLRDRGIRLGLHGDSGPVFGALDKAEGLPLDLVMIEPRDVARAGKDEKTTEKLRLALVSAKSHGLPVLALGIESEAARDWLVSQGATLGCGPSLGPSVAAAELSRQLTAVDKVKAA